MTEINSMTSEDFPPEFDIQGKSSGAWEKPVRKVLYTLDIGNYQPAIKALTMPLMKSYADKIGAEFHPITERKFPGWPIVYEKLQIFELGRLDKMERDGVFRGNESPPDWNIFFDADALISPEMFDITVNISPDTVLFNGKDMSQVRFRPDQYFRRDGRYIGACNWFACASSMCLDLWHPLDDLTLADAVQNIKVTVQEHNSGMFGDNHLIDDYTLSRNVSKFGLKHDTLIDICGRMGMRDQFGRGVNPWLWHKYSCTEKEKIEDMLRLLSTPSNQPAEVGGGRQMQGWNYMSMAQAAEFRARLFQNERGHWDLKA